MEGHCSTGQSPQWAVVPMEEEEGEEEEEEDDDEKEKKKKRRRRRRRRRRVINARMSTYTVNATIYRYECLENGERKIFTVLSPAFFNVYIGLLILIL